MFTTYEIIERLKVLWRKLEDEGHYVGANTVQLAVVRLEELANEMGTDYARDRDTHARADK
jgi:hypothetical protein